MDKPDQYVIHEMRMTEKAPGTFVSGAGICLKWALFRLPANQNAGMLYTFVSDTLNEVHSGTQFARRHFRSFRKLSVHQLATASIEQPVLLRACCADTEAAVGRIGEHTHCCCLCRHGFNICQRRAKAGNCDAAANAGVASVAIINDGETYGIGACRFKMMIHDTAFCNTGITERPEVRLAGIDIGFPACIPWIPALKRAVAARIGCGTPTGREVTGFATAAATKATNRNAFANSGVTAFTQIFYVQTNSVGAGFFVGVRS